VEIVLIHASVYSLPVSNRAEAIVYDGALDLDLWRPLGPDRDLLEAYGDTLQTVLTKERAQLPGRRLELGQSIRIHPGKLRCDFLIWVASRQPHEDTVAAAAPPPEEIEDLVQAALKLASKHGAVKVAFGNFGAGPGAAEPGERMAAVVRGADAYRKACLRDGESQAVEEVYICAAKQSELSSARRLTARLAKQALVATEAPVSRPPAAKSPARASSAPRKAKARKLDANEVASARLQAAPYDRTHAYYAGEWFVHPAFGTGQVQAVFGPERMVTALFEDGEERRLIHARPAP
jgi:O-acetyl-ADP-ribose deacetylase (regulator of RNase III)